MNEFTNTAAVTPEPAPVPEQKKKGDVWVPKLILGLISIFLGIVVLGAPVVSTVATIWLFGWILFIGGIFIIFGSLFNWEESGIWIFLGGILNVLFGLMFINSVLISTVAVTGIMAIFFIIQGVISIVQGIQVKESRWLLIFLGVISIFFGFVIFGNFMASSLLLVGLLLGWHLVLSGFATIAQSTFSSNDPGTARKVIGIILVVFIAAFLFIRIFGDNNGAGDNLPLAVYNNTATLEEAVNDCSERNGVFTTCASQAEILGQTGEEGAFTAQCTMACFPAK